jgi:hypothetical protein
MKEGKGQEPAGASRIPFSECVFSVRQKYSLKKNTVFKLNSMIPVNSHHGLRKKEVLLSLLCKPWRRITYCRDKMNTCSGRNNIIPAIQ